MSNNSPTTPAEPTPHPLNENEARLAAILDTAADGIMTTDEHGLIQSFNPAAARIFGYQPHEVLGQNIRLLIPRPYLREHESYRPATATPDTPVFSMGREVVGRHKQGHDIPLDLSVSQCRVHNKTLFTAIARDITDQKTAHAQLTNSREQLRSLAARLQTVREQERTRISREIHDELGQTLTGVKMDLSWILAKLPSDRPDLAQRAQSASHLVDHTVQTVRKIAAELRPGILDNLGLAAAIEWQGQEFQARTGIQCRCSTQIDQTLLDPDRCTAIFRIFQETITNVMRHAHATAVDVSLRQLNNQVVLQVHDNGCGITPAQHAGANSIGLLGMHERAQIFHGQFDIRGHPNMGTTVTLTIPLVHPDNREIPVLTVGPPTSNAEGITHRG